LKGTGVGVSIIVPGAVSTGGWRVYRFAGNESMSADEVAELRAKIRDEGASWPSPESMADAIADGLPHGRLQPLQKHQAVDEWDGRYALHCFPPADNEDAFYVTGRARRVDDDNEETSVRKTFWKERGQDEPPPQAEGQVVFEFLIETCLLTRTTGHGDWNPQHTIWKAP